MEIRNISCKELLQTLVKGKGIIENKIQKIAISIVEISNYN